MINYIWGWYSMEKDIANYIKNFDGEDFNALREGLYVAFPHVATSVIDRAVIKAELDTALYNHGDVEFLRRMIRAAQEELNS